MLIVYLSAIYMGREIKLAIDRCLSKVIRLGNGRMDTL